MHVGNGARLRGSQMRFEVSPGSVSLGIGLQHTTLKRFRYGKQ